jgi:hypothetical protein
MKRGGSISIWFFIGISLLVNGLLILGAGIYELAYPPQVPVVLFHLHSSIWWGAILASIGAFYCIYYAPGKGRS